MFYSLVQALGLDSTLFVQLALFCVFYPLMSRFLTGPFLRLQEERQKQTVQKIKEAELLKQKNLQQEKTYRLKALQLQAEFKKLYNQKKQELQKQFYDKKQQQEREIQEEYRNKELQLQQEFDKAGEELSRHTGPLAWQVFKRLGS